MAPFWVQLEETDPLWRDPALQLAYVGWPHRARCALSHTKVTTVAPIQYVLTGPNHLQHRAKHGSEYWHRAAKWWPDPRDEFGCCTEFVSIKPVSIKPVWIESVRLIQFRPNPNRSNK